jgi:hypothetical protein
MIQKLPSRYSVEKPRITIIMLSSVIYLIQVCCATREVRSEAELVTRRHSRTCRIVTARCDYGMHASPLQPLYDEDLSPSMPHTTHHQSHPLCPPSILLPSLTLILTVSIRSYTISLPAVHPQCSHEVK